MTMLPFEESQQRKDPTLAIRMLSEREIEMGAAFQYGGRVCEFAESPFPVICTHSGMSDTSERNAFNHHVQADFVDAASSVLEAAHNFIRPFHVLGKQVHGQRMLPAFNDIKDSVYVFVAEWYNGKNRAEQFLLNDIFLNLYRIDNCRGKAE